MYFLLAVSTSLDFYYIHTIRTHHTLLPLTEMLYFVYIARGGIGASSASMAAEFEIELWSLAVSIFFPLLVLGLMLVVMFKILLVLLVSWCWGLVMV